MKKKILFMIKNMNVGGTEKALLNMIAEMPKDKYDITIFMLEYFGGFLEDIPSHVHVSYLSGFKDIKDTLNNPPQVTIKKLIKKGRIVKALNLTALHLYYKLSNNRIPFFKYLLKNQPSLNQEYDIAVAYAGPMDFISYFIVHKIRAKKKFQWIHFDISKLGFNYRFASKLYRHFNQIFVVSEDAKKILVNKIPKLKDRIDTFYNVVSQEQVTTLALKDRGFEDDFTGYRILTVGRLSNEKGQDLTIPVLAKLKENGYNVRWYCIGEGHARKSYEELIKKYGLEEDYLLLGSNRNPYPFMKECDIYVQSSRHEGYCITLAEARCFTNPIVSTKFTGAEEQISHNQTGLLVNFDEEDMYNAIIKLLEDKGLRNKFKENLLYEVVNSTQEIQKLAI